MNDAMSYLPGVASEPWIMQLSTILSITLILYLMQVIFFKFFERRFEKTPRNWDDAFISAVRVPLSCAIWFFGLTLSLNLLHKTVLPYSILEPVENFRNLGMAILLVWFLLRLVKGVKHNMLVIKPTGKDYDVTTVHALAKFSQLASIIIGLLIIMQALNIPISGIIAFGGGSALIVGIAAQDLLANFFGSIVVFIDKPFKVNDWIVLPDKGLEGTVEYIGWRQTRIREFDKRALYVPNSMFTKSPIRNPSRMTHRRIRQTIGIRYTDMSVLAAITKDIKAMLKSHKEIDDTMALFVNLVNFGDSSLDILVYAFTKTTIWVPFQEIQQDILLSMGEIVKKHGAQIAFPTRTVEVPAGVFVQEGAS